MKKISESQSQKKQRGVSFKFMWLDLSVEKNWAKIFSFDNDYGVIFLNPGSTKKYFILEGKITEENIRKQLIIFI